jgi:hypothetical protein
MGKANPLHSCEGKVPYETHRTASEVAAKLRKRKHARISLYRCRCCRRWHIGGSKWKATRN